MSSDALQTVNPNVFNFIKTIKPADISSNRLTFSSSAGKDESRNILKSLSTGLADQKLLFPFITTMVQLSQNQKPFLRALKGYIDHLLNQVTQAKEPVATTVRQPIQNTQYMLELLANNPDSYTADDSDSFTQGQLQVDVFTYQMGANEFVFNMAYRISPDANSIGDISLLTTVHGEEVQALTGTVLPESALEKALSQLWLEQNG